MYEKELQALHSIHFVSQQYLLSTNYMPHTDLGTGEYNKKIKIMPSWNLYSSKGK